MSKANTGSGASAEPSVVEQTVDEVGFARLVEAHRRELQIHCYRMLGSYEDSEDLVQETFLRAWRKRETYQGRSTFRAWLYRIATNACLDFLERNPRKPSDRTIPAQGGSSTTVPDEIPWLQPYPDQLLEMAAPSEADPDVVVVAKETIELAFLAAIQYLPPQQRAVLILRDVLGWPALETAQLLEVTVATVNNATLRARARLKERLPERRLEWPATDDPTTAERALLQRYMTVLERFDATIVAELLHEDVRITMPPNPTWFVGRDAVAAQLARVLDPESPAYHGAWRSVPCRANRQPAVAHYIRAAGDDDYRPWNIDVLRVEEGRIVEITAFGAKLFPAFGLPDTL
ncbi:RNA polymerase sigma-70 factor (ECF subfamily) [Allocatelliglobosispora scoriae]|uniref:RNA polymerase sigma factor n=1 Tax=Allocatelliglobosispora scoriae TaxID=643052 RepID=A0A841BP67_9ACTN|nr:sigma-70 family RNA polymerase sigma factor [Allocatelliglobosispora scoriae]MBB5870064.1 RNA polymerase sigma-70 factor (ECF subfamily) [Allocatelliglobosispora scoriae]